MKIKLSLSFSIRSLFLFFENTSDRMASYFKALLSTSVCPSGKPILVKNPMIPYLFFSIQSRHEKSFRIDMEIFYLPSML